MSFNIIAGSPHPKFLAIPSVIITGTYEYKIN